MRDDTLSLNMCKHCVRIEPELREAYQTIYRRLWILTPEAMTRVEAEEHAIALTKAVMAATCPECACDDCIDDANSNVPFNAYRALEVSIEVA
jgi:hypothetical protein